MGLKQSPSDCMEHQWKDEYYGYKCKLCGLFIPENCAPWNDDETEMADHASEDWIPLELIDDAYAEGAK